MDGGSLLVGRMPPWRRGRRNPARAVTVIAGAKVPSHSAVMASAPIVRRAYLDGTAVAVLVFLTALWGLQQVSVKVAIADGLAPALQAALRSAGAALCVFVWIAAREGRAAIAALVARSTLLPGLGVAVLFAAEFLALYDGLRLTTASRGVVFVYSAPFFVALGAHLIVPGERLRLVQFAGLGLAFVGMGAAFAEGLLAGGGSVRGDLLCLLGGVLWAATTLCVKASPALSAAAPATLLWLQLVGSAPILFAVAWLRGELAPFPQVGLLGWTGLFYQTVIIAFASYLVWFRLILTYPAGRVASFTFLAPVFGIVAGWALMGDALSWGLFVGLAAIGAGMRMVNAR